MSRLVVGAFQATPKAVSLTPHCLPQPDIALVMTVMADSNSILGLSKVFRKSTLLMLCIVFLLNNSLYCIEIFILFCGKVLPVTKEQRVNGMESFHHLLSSSVYQLASLCIELLLMQYLKTIFKNHVFCS